MKLIFQLILAYIGTFLFFQCSENKKEYESLDVVFKDVANVINSKDSTKITKFVISITPNLETAKTMIGKNCNFRGFPLDTPMNDELFKNAQLENIRHMKDIIRSLKTWYGKHDSLLFVGFVKEPKPQKVKTRECNCEDIFIEAPIGIYVFKNTKDSIEIKVGEMLKINDEWKTFTGIKMNLVNYKDPR